MCQRNTQPHPLLVVFLSLLLLLAQPVSTSQAAKAAGQKLNNQLLAATAISNDDAWAVGYAGNSRVNHTLTQHWDGTSWRIVPSFSSSGSDAFSSVTAISKSDVWAVGTTNGQPLIEHWNGNRWQTSAGASLPPQPDGSVSYRRLNSISAVNTKDIWAVGGMSHYPLVEHWDGTSWQYIKVPDSYDLGYTDSYYTTFDNTLTSVKALSANNVYISGPNLLEHWDGKSWRILEHPALTSPTLTALSSKNIWVGGNTFLPATNSLVHWDGQRWQFFSLPFTGEQNHYLKGLLTIQSDDVWSVGFIDYIVADCCSTHLTLIAHWNGQHWQRIPSPNSSPNDNNLLAIAGSGPNDIWAVGYTSRLTASYESGPGSTLIEHWDGVRWQVVASPNI